MATQRFGHLDDFTLKNTNVGIGTSTPQDKMEVIGGTRSTDLRVAGIATLTSAGGFIEKHTGYVENVNMTTGDSGTLSGEIVVGSGLTMTVGTAATTSQGTVEALKVYDMFKPPSGGTNQRPPAKTGAIFYNFDFKTIEFFDGNSWRQVDNTTRRGRGLILGGFVSPASVSNIESIEISTGGSAVDFGTMNTARFDAASSSSSTRGISGGGSTPTYLNEIEYTTIASSGNGIDFGDLNATNMSYSAGCSSSTRGMFNGGFQSSPAPHAYLDDMNYVEIATIGDAFDFANLSVSSYAFASCSSSTRGFIAGGDTPSGDFQIQVYKIADKSNTVPFGDLSQARFDMKGCSSTVRGVFGGGRTPSYTSTIDYVTMASEGNATDFGDLLVAAYRHASCGNQTRGLWMGGNNPDGNIKTIQSITFSTTGNAVDYGDISYETGSGCPSGYSDSHGGLGGF